MLDPFPFWGGNCTRSAWLCAPQSFTFPGTNDACTGSEHAERDSSQFSGLIVNSVEEYIDTTTTLLNETQDDVSPSLLELRAHICKEHDARSQEAVQEWDLIWYLH